MQRMKTPRPSSIPRLCVLPEGDVTPDSACYSEDHRHKPNPEWWITEDGVEFTIGDCVYNYYDGEWGTVVEKSFPDLMFGWFDFKPHGQNFTKSLNSVRVSAREPRR
jgi:hypothetical protein